MSERTVSIEVRLSDEEAWEFAQFLKRVCFETWLEYVEYGLPKPEATDRAYAMRNAGLQIREALAEAGYSPR